MTVEIDKPDTQAPVGRASFASESPRGAAQAAELLTEVWFSVCVGKAERRPMRWIAKPDDYWAIVNLCTELARDSDANEVSELLDGASNGDELVTVWCYLIDDAGSSVRKRWRPALQACKRALEMPDARRSEGPSQTDA